MSTANQAAMTNWTACIVYQVYGKELVRIPSSFLNRMKGVYGWYVLRQDLEVLGPEYRLPAGDQASGKRKIYLYIGTVKDGSRRSVATRFVGELLGPQISCDQNRSFDTDFAVSCAIEFLCNNGVSVYFDVLSSYHGGVEEVRIANAKQPVLQEITPRTVRLRGDIKRKIAGKDLNEEIRATGEVVLQRLKECLSNCRG
jgi:hypothetical protein